MVVTANRSLFCQHRLQASHNHKAAFNRKPNRVSGYTVSDVARMTVRYTRVRSHVRGIIN